MSSTQAIFPNIRKHNVKSHIKCVYTDISCTELYTHIHIPQTVDHDDINQ